MLCHQLRDKHRVFLPDAVGAVGRLVFRRRIPPGVDMNDPVRRRQVQAHATGLQGDEEDHDLALLELPDHIAALLLGVRAGETQAVQSSGCGFVPQNIQHAGKLGKDQDLMACLGQLFQQVQAGVYFAGAAVIVLQK